MTERDAQICPLLPLYVVVLNWNLPQQTIVCVRSVQANQIGEMQIVVIDNGSTDCSVEMLKQHFGDTIQLLSSSENLGFAAGANLGIQHALCEGAQSVLLLNNDTIVDAEMVIHLLSAMAKRPEAGIVAPVIYYHDNPGRVWQIGSQEHRWLPIPVGVSQRVLSGAAQAPFRLDYVTACGMLVRRSVWEAVGQFDVRYFMYFEDADFCRRVRYAGLEIWCAPQARMWHRVSSSARKQGPGSRYAEAWGRAHFYRAHGHGPFATLTMAHVLLKSVRITLRDLLTRQRGLAVPLWRGTFDGLSDRPSQAASYWKPKKV
jgi:GT2 family glycosyltransferase